MKIVLDTNCLIVIVPKKSAYRKVYEMIRTGKIELAITNEILTEYEEQLTDFYSASLAQNVVKQLLELKNISLVNVYYNWNLIKVDVDDNKFIDCAVSCNADLIVTNDKHFNVLDKIEFPKVNHIKLQDFIKLI